MFLDKVFLGLKISSPVSGSGWRATHRSAPNKQHSGKHNPDRPRQTAAVDPNICGVTPNPLPANLSRMSSTNSFDVLVVGGGVAGSTTGMFTARSGLDTFVVDSGESMLQKNAHLENFPGFPLGIDSELFLELLHDQAERAGCTFLDDEVVDLDRHPDTGFVAKTTESDRWEYRADRVVAATAGDQEYLAELELDTVEADGSTFLNADTHGRTSVDGLYAAGRIAGKELQAVVAAGHGAEVGTTVVDDAGVPLAHDWVVPEGHFTDRGKEVPPGCEEISVAQREERHRRSIEHMREYFSTTD
jgi:thioredoxin reductase (NADPH)